MSGKPDDIPDDVWLEAGMKFDQLYDAEPDLEGGCEYGIKSMAARMVMAERKRCAEIAVSCGANASTTSATITRVQADMADRIAAAILE